MSHFPTSWTPWPIWRETPYRPWLLNLLVVLGVVAFSNLLPSMSLSAAGEGEKPAEQCELFEEAVLSLRDRGQARCARPSWTVPVAVLQGKAVASTRPSAPKPGHRLHNHLLAPLRC